MKKILINFVLLFFPIIQIVLIFLFLNVSWGVTFAQIKIEERVEINPQKILTNYPPPQYTPCSPWPPTDGTDYYNPRQVVWNSNYINIDPYQQLFNYQHNLYSNYGLFESHTYDVTIGQGIEYCYIEKQLFDPVTEEWIGTEVIGHQLTGMSGVDLIGTGGWFNGWCVPHEKERPSDYYIIIERDVPQGAEIIVTITDLTGYPPTYQPITINYHTI